MDIVKSLKRSNNHKAGNVSVTLISALIHKDITTLDDAVGAIVCECGIEYAEPSCECVHATHVEYSCDIAHMHTKHDDTYNDWLIQMTRTCTDYTNN